MPRATDPFRQLVEVHRNHRWKCRFCGNEFAGSAARIRAHLAGVKGFGILGCEAVNARVRSEALNSFQCKRVAESSNRRDNVEEALHQPMTVSNEDGWRETYLSSGASSWAFLPLPGTNFPSQSLPTQNMTPQRDFSCWPQPPQSHAGDFYIQPRIFSDTSGGRNLAPEALTSMPCPLNAEGGEPDTKVPRVSKVLLVGDQSLETYPLTLPWDTGEVPRARDPFWEPVEVLHNNRWKCNFCGSEYAGSATRIKAHFAGGCKVVDAQVRSEALQALQLERPLESSNKQGNFEGSSNLTQDSPQPLTASNEDASSEISFAAMPRPLNAEDGELNTEVPQGARTQVAPVEIESEPELANKNTTSLKTKLEELINSAEADMNELESKWKRIEEEYLSVVQAIKEGRSLPPEKVAEVEKLSTEVEDLLPVPGRFGKESTALAKGCSRRSPFVTTELVGEQTHRQGDEIYAYLMQDNISIIGIYGMGGVGKTTLAKLIYNKLLKDTAFDNVLWVSVPQDFSMHALQEKMANVVGLDDFSKEKDLTRRAGILYGHLKKKRSVVILDDLWVHFKVEDVGIPVETGGLKLVLTTRSLDVCHMMLCQKQIKIELLNVEDSWRLFSKTLCFPGEIPWEVEQIARSLLNRCCGLPLGIIEMATHMRGVMEVHEWKGMLEKLENSRAELDVFKRLKLGGINSGNHQVQWCFLHLILCFGEGLLETNGEDLVESFIDEGLLGGNATRQELHERGNSILDEIRKAFLLGDPEKEYQYLHPLTKEMTLDMVTSITHMVKAYMGLKEIPEEVFWTDSLEKVFLQGNKIEEIPYGISPNCPKLSRLSLNDNVTLGVINESFFRHLKGLMVLDLSNTRITILPDSISHLESLEALSLRMCRALRRIPYVGKLGSLRKLDLQGCASLEEVPEGMEMLVNLRYLDLDDTKIETLPEGVLGKLVNLQYLAIKKLRAGEEAKLKNVEALHCSVPNVETFNSCVRFLERNSCQRYRLVMGAPDCYPFWCIDETERCILIDSCDHITVSVDGTSVDGCALLPESVQSLEVSRCHKMKRVMEWEWLTTRLPNLKEIVINNCGKLEEMIGGPLPRGATCHLTYLGVTGCNNMKRVLLTQDKLLHLPFLQEISVEDCKGIEVIIGTVANMTHSSFPKLIRLSLWNLLELKSICDGTTSWDSLRWISIYNCPKLKRIPLQLHQLDNGLPSPPPSLREIRINQRTWESLEWDDPLARSSLEPFVKSLDLMSQHDALLRPKVDTGDSVESSGTEEYM